MYDFVRAGQKKRACFVFYFLSIILRAIFERVQKEFIPRTISAAIGQILFQKYLKRHPLAERVISVAGSKCYPLKTKALGSALTEPLPCWTANGVRGGRKGRHCHCVIVKDMPNPLHIVSRVATEGTVFLLKILPIVDCAKPHSFESLYSVHPRSLNNCWRRACVSIPVKDAVVSSLCESFL